MVIYIVNVCPFIAISRSKLFELDGIRDKVSNQTLKAMGGTPSLMAALKTSPTGGINIDDAQEVELRKTAFGENLPIIKEPKSFLELVTEQFEDKILRILTAAAFVSLCLGIYTEGIEEGWLEGFTIFLAVTIIVLVTATNNYLKEQQFQKLNAQREQRDVSVIRNGKTISISIYKLLVGDVMHITTGEMFPADGLLIKGNELSVDESSMTGESHLIRKTVLEDVDSEKAQPFIISGSKVMEGTGLMLVLAIGGDSQMGIMKKKLQEETPPTALQLKLANLADQIGKLGTYAAAATFSLMLLHFLLERIVAGHCIVCMESLLKVVDFFIVAVTIIVVAVPEGLPLAVTIALAYSVNKMKDENNLVRVLASCEVMGGANNICSDKTGTLTQNRMSVERLWVEEQIKSTISKHDIGTDTQQLMCEK
jgi:calcium-translocating P-type ATPase